MTEAKLVQLKGAPQTKAALGKKAIYRWPDMEVTLVEGKVEQVRLRDRMTERQNAQQRAAAEAEKKKEVKHAAIEAKQSVEKSKQAAVTAESAEDRRLSRMVYLQADVRAMERQLEEDSKRSSFGRGIPPMSAEARALLTIRLEKARAEIAGLK